MYIYKALRVSRCAIRIFMGLGAPNSRAAPGSPHSSYATSPVSLLALSLLCDLRLLNNGEVITRNSHLFYVTRHRAKIMPARMKANGNFSDASVERFCSARINRMMNPSDAVDLGRPCNSLFEFQVVYQCVFKVV